MSLLAASALISGGINAAKGIFGLAQSVKANKDIKRLNATMPKYKRPDEYAQELAMRAKMAGQGQLPGLGQITDNISGATASAYGAAEKGAISSNTYMGAVGDIYQKQLNAFQDLGVKSAEFQQTQKENYMNTLQKGAQYSDTEFEQNQRLPWDIKMNEAQSQKQAGGTNLWNGLEGGASAFSSFAGTKYYADIMKGLQGGGQSSKVSYNPNQIFSKPVTSVSPPQQNLLNTLMGIRPEVNWPVPKINPSNTGKGI